MVAGVGSAIEEGVDRAVIHELLLGAGVRGSAAVAEVGVSHWNRTVVSLLVHGHGNVSALNICGRPHAAQRKEDCNESFDEGAELGAADCVVVEDGEDHCKVLLAMLHS